jgi:hypothetical protein
VVFNTCGLTVKLKYVLPYKVSGEKMPKKLTVLIDDKLDERFREAVFKKKGMHKGNITDAIEEAIECWMEKEETEQKKKGK